MKKRFTAFISLILSVLIGMACLSGCRLVTVDNQRDMDQIIATIKVNDGEEHIYKKDLVMEYLNYGYLYVQYYGYTAEKTYNMLFDEMVTSRILAQGAMKYFEEEADKPEAEEERFIADSSKAAYDIERYVDAQAVKDAEYNTYKAINSLLESAEPNQEDKVQDSIIDTVRTTPEGAAVSESEFTPEEKDTYVKKGFSEYTSENASSDKKEAFNNVIKILVENELLGSEFKDNRLETTEYFINTKNSYLEAELLEKLEEHLSLEARKSVTFEKLAGKYIDEYNKQKDWSNADFVEALRNASVSSPMVYSKFGGYGYVYNLLLGATEEQTEKINAIREDNPNISDADYAIKRAEILNSSLIKDLRSGWILSGYDTKEVVNGEDKNLVFTGDYTFAKDEKNSLAFQGEYKLLKEADEENKTPAKYSVTDVKNFELNGFIDFMDAYLGGSSEELKDTVEGYKELGIDVYSAKKLTGVEEYKAKINELLFAFSTDDGSLNTYNGYVIKPAVDGSNTEEYVKTFGDAGRVLLEQGTDGYVIVASDFGYHVMFYSEKFGADFEIKDLVAYLNAESGLNKEEAGWTEYYNKMIQNWEEFEKEDNYLYHLAEKLTSAKVTNALDGIKRDIINTNRYEESDKVLLYKNLFEDLYK